VKPVIVIEYPAVGATYRHDAYGVYQYDAYPQGTVLAGQERRSALDQFGKFLEAREAYPDAEWDGEGVTGYRKIPLVDPLAGSPAVLTEPWDEPGEAYDD
jgi:hypothetical protein